MYKFVWQMMKGIRLKYLLAIIAIGLASFFQFLAPLVMKVTIDSIIGGEAIQLPLGVGKWLESRLNMPWLVYNLWLAGSAYVLLRLLTNIFMYLRGRWSAYCSEELARRLRNKLFDHIQNLPFAWHSKVMIGDIVQRCTSDVETIRRFLGVQLVQIGRGILMVAIVVPIMFSLSPKMALVSMIVVPVIFSYAIIFFYKVKKVFKEADEQEGFLTTVLEESVGGIRVVKAFARQDYEINRFNSAADSYREKSYKMISVLAWYWSTSDMLSVLQIGVVLIYGTHLAIQDVITLGTLVVFMTYVNSFLWPIRETGRILTDLGRAFVSVARLQEILNSTQEDFSGEYTIPNDKRLEGRIVFRDVSFYYEKDKSILKNINLSIAPGETIAIIGATGAGKSSLVHLLPRLFDYQEGSILLDGIELNTYQRKNLRYQIGIVLQEPFLYSRTIKENIAIARESLTEEQIHQAAKESALHDTVMDFEKAYETIVGEKGITLSGGQRQRMAIARTLILNPPVLILDDALSSVDSETERIIQHHLRLRKGKATTIIITHRFTSLAIADRIVVMEHGQIVQIGKHSELIAQEGHYRDIWDIQHQLEQEVDNA